MIWGDKRPLIHTAVSSMKRINLKNSDKLAVAVYQSFSDFWVLCGIMEAELDTEGKIFLNILFWDIDGTLIRTGKAGLFAFQAAAAERGLGPVDYRQVQAAGMTDYSIASQILEKLAGQSVTHQAVRELADRYEELLPEHLEQHEGRVLPSVRDILAALRETGTISLLLTGNSRKGAEAKMRKFGLESYFDFERSAFCENSQTRDDVAGRALLSVQEMAVTQAARVFVIGDTPNDIRCGKNIGAYTIGVATGTFSEIDLSKHEPWWVTKQLPSATEFMARLFDAVPKRFQR